MEKYEEGLKQWATENKIVLVGVVALKDLESDKALQLPKIKQFNQAVMEHVQHMAVARRNAELAEASPPPIPSNISSGYSYDYSYPPYPAYYVEEGSDYYLLVIFAPIFVNGK